MASAAAITDYPTVANSVDTATLIGFECDALFTDFASTATLLAEWFAINTPSVPVACHMGVAGMFNDIVMEIMPMLCNGPPPTSDAALAPSPPGHHLVTHCVIRHGMLRIPRGADDFAAILLDVTSKNKPYVLQLQEEPKQGLQCSLAAVMKTCNRTPSIVSCIRLQMVAHMLVQTSRMSYQVPYVPR